MKKLLSLIITVLLLSTFTGSLIDKHYSEEKHIHESGNLSQDKGKNKISQLISDQKRKSNFKNADLFSFNKEAASDDNSSSFVSKAVLLNLDKNAVSEILRSKNKNIIFRIPVQSNSSIELELTQSFPVSPDFILKSKNENGSRIESYTPGLHYRGIIKGKENSLASISIFDTFVMGLISDETGNYVLGSVKNPDNSYSENYIFYNDADMTVKSNFKCGVDEDEEKFIKPVNESIINVNPSESNDNVSSLPVKVYFEADYQMYIDASSNVNTLVNFITGMFNQVVTIYQNESIPFVISSIAYWDSPDPYRNINVSFPLLKRFGGDNGDNIEGNIAHLISTRNAGLGGIAWIRVLCAQFNQNDSSGRFAFSNIEGGYNNYPTYSWTVNVVAHEMGHNLGSRHTHSCVWPVGGIIRAIDSCYYSEGGCFSDALIRPRVGTIMSYCHLWPENQGGGINLASGFGQLPGDTIRLRYAQAPCMDRLYNSSEQPTSFSLKQNFPNPFNPSTTITFTLPADANISLKVYDVSGRLIADVIRNKFYSTGFYDYQFNSELYNLSSGIYFYSLESEGRLVGTKRMVLIK